MGFTSGDPSSAGVERDHVETIIDGWRRERPDVDPAAMGVVARISRLSRIMEKIVNAELVKHGLTLTSFGILGALRRAGPPYSLSPKDLHESLLVASGTVTNQLDRLEELQLIARQPHPRDRRAISVMLTPMGLRVIDDALSDFVQTERDLLGGIDAETVSLLSSALQGLLVGLGDQPMTDTVADQDEQIDPDSADDRKAVRFRFSSGAADTPSAT